MNLGHWLRHPHRVPARIRYWLWERWNADKPWLTPGAVSYCERHLTTTMTAVEFGSGRSTAWFAKCVGHLTSVEHDRQWYDEVRAMLARAGLANVEYRLVPLDHSEDVPEQSAYDPLPAYVAVLNDFADGSLDFVVVDGHYRGTCIKHALRKLRAGGILLVDDTNLWPSREALPVPSSWSLISATSNEIKETCIWRKPANAAGSGQSGGRRP